jgi:hypothetical protein
VKQGRRAFLDFVPADAVRVNQLDNAVETFDDSGVNAFYWAHSQTLGELGHPLSQDMLPGLTLACLLVPTVLQQHEQQQGSNDHKSRNEVEANDEKLDGQCHWDGARTQDSKVWGHDRTPWGAIRRGAHPARRTCTRARLIMFRFVAATSGSTLLSVD